jgi:tetratricopeptide (TPR) repeat protein
MPELPCRKCMRISKLIYHLFLLALPVLATVFQSCQSDARNSTRIPPLVKKNRVQWEKDAILSLSELINRGIDLDANYFKRSRIYYDQEQYKLALEDINSAIDEQENVGEYFVLRGKINLELGDYDQGLEDAERAEVLQQGSPELYVLLADLLQSKGRFREAGRYLRHAMKLAPYDASAYYVQGMLQAKQGDSLASLASLDYAMTHNPRMLRAYLQSIIINTKLQNLGQALTINNRAINRFPQIAELYFERGQIYKVLSQPDTAVIYYQKAIAINPKYTTALSQMADLSIKNKYYHKAITALTQLLKLDPKYPQIHNLLGYCYEKLGNYPKAREYYGITLEMDQGDRAAHNGMWRMKRNENEGSYYSGDRDEDDYRLTDTSRVKINLIQPRKTINIPVDSSRKVKIQ